MARSVAWRRQASDAASWHQDEASNATIYILREMGPTGFLLKEEGETKKYKVFLGDPHSCTCQTFMKEKDLCKHICWVMLKKFRVPRENQITWQLGLVEREINEILKGMASNQTKPSAAARRLAKSASTAEQDGGSDEEEAEGAIKQRPIAEDDVCPICQEEFFDKHLPVTYCKFGCGNNVHIKCMKVWADHQKTMAETVIKCPLCREDFGPFSLLQEEARNSSMRHTRAERIGQHLATTCGKCRIAPIVGKCYKCTVCAEFYLCQNCFITPMHREHNFEFREKPNQRWKPAQRGTGSVLPGALVNAMMNRELGDNDYEMLLQLDNQAAQTASDLSQETIQSFPTERVRKNGHLLAPGEQCLVCLQRYSEGQVVKKLPCKHKFHRDCIDNWLLHQHATCPVDGTVYTNESVRAYREAQKARQQQQRQEKQNPRGNPQEGIMLEIPGIGIVQGSRPLGSSGALRRCPIRGPQARVVDPDPGFAISGVSLANGNDLEPEIERSHSGAGPRSVQPLLPIPPSIPRLHDGNRDLSIRSHSHVTIGNESPNSRPPSGQQAGSTRNTGRTRARPIQGVIAGRNRSSSRSRRQSSERLHPTSDLYLGSEQAGLLTNESHNTPDSDRVQGRHTRVSSVRNRPSNNSPARGQGTTGLILDSTRIMSGDSDLAFGAVDAVFEEYMGNLHLGNEPRPISHGSAGRLRHGHIAAAGPREQAQAIKNDYSSPSSSPSHSLNKNSLYIGADPVSTEGCLRNFLLNSIAQRNSAKASATKRSNKETTPESEHRWGQVREMRGQENSMVLSGSAVQAATDE